MKKIVYIATIGWFYCLSYISAQNSVNDVLTKIEDNNTTLKAYREKSKADKIGDRVGLNIPNPEVEFGYLWGSPSDKEGNETDWSVKQSFDFPTAYRYKSQLADGKNLKTDLMYSQQAKTILQQARLFCLELVYRTKMQKKLEERYNHAKELANAYQKRFDNGDIDILELNKTKLSLLNQEKALELNKIEIVLLNNELQRMNGGEPLNFDLYNYSIYSIPVNFDEWFVRIKHNNPEFLQTEHDITLSKKQEQLTKAMNLPKFTLGYTNQYISGTTQQGVTVGVSVPLWESKNTVKHQKAQTFALQMIKDDYDLQFKNELRGQYDKALQLKKMLKDYETLMDASNNERLLKKSLELGQLSLINYLLELTVYYDTTDKYLETEKEYELALAQLEQWEF